MQGVTNVHTYFVFYSIDVLIKIFTIDRFSGLIDYNFVCFRQAIQEVFKVFVYRFNKPTITPIRVLEN